MKTLFFTLMVLFLTTQAYANITATSANGIIVKKPGLTLAVAATSPDLVGAIVVVNSVLSSAFSNISSVGGWPSDRKLRIEHSGRINNTNLFRIKGPFEAGEHQVFLGTGDVIVNGKVNVYWFGAVANAITDCTAAFRRAFYAVKAAGLVTTGTDTTYPANVKSTLYGPSGTYAFSGPIITPTAAAPTYSNFDIKFDNAVFKALPGYTATDSFIRTSATYDMEISGIGFVGFKTYYPIFLDSSSQAGLPNNNHDIAKTTYSNLSFRNCDYGIRHELESTQAVIEKCRCDYSMITFLSVCRADQMTIRDGWFGWDQDTRSAGDAFIIFGLDQYSNPADTANPGVNNYAVGRLLIENCIFTPTGSSSTIRPTAWIKLVSGSLRIKNSHFGPESVSRPITVYSMTQGALVTSLTSQIDTGIVLEDNDIVTSYGVIYCKAYLPNYIHVRNNRWNFGDNGLPSSSNVRVYVLTGDAASGINTYTTAYAHLFSYNFGSGVPQYYNIMPVDPALTFAKSVSTYSPLSIGALYSGQVSSFDILGRGGALAPFPIFDQNGGSYEATITGTIQDSVTGGSYGIMVKGVIDIFKSYSGGVPYLNIAFTQSYITPIGTSLVYADPTVTAEFHTLADVGSDQITVASLASTKYFLRVKLAHGYSRLETADAVLSLKRIN